MPKNVYLPFIREGEKEPAIAITRLEFRSEVAPKVALEKLQQAVAVWIKTTPGGKKTWAASCGDLNIGDLALHDVEFRKWIQKQAKLNKKSALIDLLDFELVFYWLGQEGSVDFNKHLVTENIPYKEGEE